MLVERGGLGLVDFLKHLHCLHVWWLKRAAMLKWGRWVPLMQKVWEARFAPRGSAGDLSTLVEGGGSRRLWYTGFWWGVAEGAHRIGIR